MGGEPAGPVAAYYRGQRLCQNTPPSVVLEHTIVSRVVVVGGGAAGPVAAYDRGQRFCQNTPSSVVDIAPAVKTVRLWNSIDQP